MRNSALILSWIIVPMICLAARAELFDRGNGLIYDSVQDITWLQDASSAAGSVYDDGSSFFDGRLTWPNAVDWADSLSYGGYSDWRLPVTDPNDTTCSQELGIGQGCTGSEMGYLYNVAGINADSEGPFNNVPPHFTWSGTEWESNPNIAFDFAFHTAENPPPGLSANTAGYQSGDSKDSDAHAWAVRDGDVLGGASPISITGYDILNADVTGTGGWAHEYTGTITPTSGSLANYSGGTGTMADGVVSGTNALSTQVFSTAANDVSITLYLDQEHTISTIDIYGGDHGAISNVIPGAITSFDIEIGSTVQTMVTSGFGPVGGSLGQDWRINDRADLVTAGLSDIAVSSIVLSNFRSIFSSNDFSVAEIVAYRSAPALELDFPIPTYTAYTHQITSILDHDGLPNKENGEILAFDGTIASCSLGACIDTVNNGCQPIIQKQCDSLNGDRNMPGTYNYKKDANSGDSLASVNFVATFDNVVGEPHISYDGHTGYDYPQAQDAIIVAPAGGVLCVATAFESPAEGELWRHRKYCNYGRDPVNNNHSRTDPWSNYHTFYIVHSNGMSTWYLHASDLAPIVRSSIQSTGYAAVNAEQHIAFVGGYPNVGPHLHFEVREADGVTIVDPYKTPVLWRPTESTSCLSPNDYVFVNRSSANAKREGFMERECD